MKKLKCICISTMLIFFAATITSAQSLYVATGNSIFITSGTIFSIDSLSLTPSNDFTIIGNNEVTKSSDPYHTIDRMYIKRVFHALTTLKPFNGTITIYYKDEELDNLGESALSLAINEDNTSIPGSYWKIFTTNVTRDATDNFVTTTGITGIQLNEATLVDPNAILPVTFTLFNASCSNGNVMLTWKTALESGTKKYDVEKSVTGSDWHVATTVNPSGQPGTEHSYTINDNNTITGNLYRVVEYDVTGRKVISSILRASCGAAESFSIYPNPVRDEAIVSINVSQSTTVLLRLTDAKGALVRHLQTSLLSGINQLQFNMAGIAKGYYNLTAYWGSQVKVSRIIKD